MATYFAFLRAINVGGRRLKMDRLRSVFSELGFANVQTFIASGNVIFEAQTDDRRALTHQIEAHLHKQLGYTVDTFLRSSDELTAIAHYHPFGEGISEHGNMALYVAFLGASITAEGGKRLLALRTSLDDFHVHGTEVYWLCRGSQRDSSFSGAALEKTVEVPATLRNINTVQRLVNKYAD